MASDLPDASHIAHDRMWAPAAFAYPYPHQYAYQHTHRHTDIHTDEHANKHANADEYTHEHARSANGYTRARRQGHHVGGP